MLDSFSRKVNYLRISVTDLCNLRCQYCMPNDGITPKKKHKDILSYEEIVSIVKEGVKLGIEKVRITGGEPLIRKDILKLVEAIAKIEGINDIALTTNGILLKEMARSLNDAGLKRVNISIDSLKPQRFKEITRGGHLGKVLDGIQEVLKLNMKPLKLNTVIIGNFNDDEVEDFAGLTLTDELDVRFIELMPVGEASLWAKERFISNEEIRQKMKNLTPIKSNDTGPATYYKLPNGKGRVGFINPISSHFCDSCNRVRLTSDGRLKPCLHSNKEIDVLNVLRNNPKELSRVLENAILAKPEKHHLYTNQHIISDRNMAEIGG